MQRTSAVLAAGLIGATGSLPAQGEPEIAIVRCETESSGNITVTHWSVTHETDDLWTSIDYRQGCAATVARLLRLGLKLLDGPQITTFSPSSSAMSYSFFFLNERGLVFPTDRTGEAGVNGSRTPSLQAGIGAAQGHSGQRTDAESIRAVRSEGVAVRAMAVGDASEPAQSDQLAQPGGEGLAEANTDTVESTRGTPHRSQIPVGSRAVHEGPDRGRRVLPKASLLMD